MRNGVDLPARRLADDPDDSAFRYRAQVVDPVRGRRRIYAGC